MRCHATGRLKQTGRTVSIPPESIQVGKCYLCRDTAHRGGDGLRVPRVIQILSDGRIQFEHRVGHTVKPWKMGVQEGRSFAFMVEREVPCDWMPNIDEA